MHDPLDKVLRIQQHGERSAQFLDRYGLQRPNEAFWKKADVIAAGFERGQVPSYNADADRNGAVDFLRNPVITHPTSEKAHLRISGIENEDAEQINKKLLEYIEKEIGMKPGKGGYSDRFSGNEARFAVARFLYTHLVLRFKLAEDNVAGLGGLWHRIPADSRFPDHSIWQHNALCSAIYSSMELSGDASRVGMMVFGITPVQPFIAKARKLRDYWTGSVILSWLAFEGMRWVIENLGPDHILYPSLIDQPLMNEYLKREWEVPEDGFLGPPSDIASFPNKFLFLVPMDTVEAVASEIEARIQQAWRDLFIGVCDTCTSMLDTFLKDEQKAFVRELFDRQSGAFWDLQWAACHLVAQDDREEIEGLLPKSAYQNQFHLLERFNRIIEDKDHYEKSGRGVLYSVTHSLVQAAFASSKIRKPVTRSPETGEKCHICGEFEVLHHKRYIGDISAGDYKKSTGEFWSMLKKAWDGDEKYSLGFNLNENEKLCSICLTKRMAYQAVEKDEQHILHTVFTGKSTFPSTTEIALTGYFERENIPAEERRKRAQEAHESPDDRTENRDRYFAILIMDGDNMGRLVNGETLASTWESVMHPHIVERLKRPSFEEKYHDNWKQIFENYNKRLMTPAVHAAVSESLADFSLYGVSRIIKDKKGRLIYAGGDDVCAVLPVEKAFDAAREIQKYYNSTYTLIKQDSSSHMELDAWSPVPGKLSINLGKGEHISISGAVLICHHKENLAQMIARAHRLLDERAKNVEGKNACSVELRKRSGGSRYFTAKWDEEAVWTAFTKIGESIRSKNKARVSSSVVYRLEQLRDGIEAIVSSPKREEMLKAFIVKQLERSSVGSEIDKDDFASKMIQIALREGPDGYEFKPEGLIVAAFMAKGGK